MLDGGETSPEGFMLGVAVATSQWVSEMGKFTEEEVNRIINLKSVDGKLIDVFDLHGVLFIGNCRKGVTIVKNGKLKEVYGWDITKTHTKYSEHSLGISIDDFELCETEQDVQDTFGEILNEIVADNLV